LFFLLSIGPWVFARSPEQVCVTFSQGVFPDLAVQDIRGSLGVWSEEVARGLQGVESIHSTVYESPEPMIAGLREKNVDLVLMPVLEYFRLESRLDVELGFVTEQGHLGAKVYHLVVGSQVPARSLEQLKGLRFACVRRDGLGLMFLNDTLLKARQPEADAFFLSVDAESKGSQALNDVYFGKADACLVSDESYRATLAMNPQLGRKLRIMLSSPVYHGALAVYRKDYPVYMRRRIQEAVNSLKRIPRGAQMMALFHTTEVRAASEQDLVEVRKLYLDYRMRKGREP